MNSRDLKALNIRDLKALIIRDLKALVEPAGDQTNSRSRKAHEDLAAYRR